MVADRLGFADPDPPLSSCVTWGELPDITKTRFLYLHTGWLVPCDLVAAEMSWGWGWGPRQRARHGACARKSPQPFPLCRELSSFCYCLKRHESSSKGKVHPPCRVGSQGPPGRPAPGQMPRRPPASDPNHAALPWQRFITPPSTGPPKLKSRTG